MDSEPAGAAFEQLVALIARLRGPGGCPWDREQTHASLKPMTIEEAYEVLEAIDQGHDEELAGELGDLLLQVVFHAQIAAEQQRFAIADVCRAISQKMVRRHPHVFGDQSADSSAEVLRNWEALKAKERQAKGQAVADESMLDSVSKALPATLEAFQLTTKTARVGFDWPDAAGALATLREELGELEAALAGTPSGDISAEAYDELGDVLFSAVNLARLLGSDPESALKGANRKFRSRFAQVEAGLRERGRTPAESSQAEMDGLWNAAKVRS